MDINRPKVGVGIILIKGRKVLMLKRKGSHGEGTWSPPGGHLEFGESLEECAKRELLEETGIRKVGKIRIGGITNDIFKKEKKHYITVAIVAKFIGGEPRIMEPDRISEIGWFDWDALPRPHFLPVKNLLKQKFSPFKR